MLLRDFGDYRKEIGVATVFEAQIQHHIIGCLLTGVGTRARSVETKPVCRMVPPGVFTCHERAVNPTEVLGAFGLPRVMSTLGKAGANPDHIMWWMINNIREPGGVDYFRALTAGQVPNVGRFVEKIGPRGVPATGTRVAAEPLVGDVMGPKGVGYFSGLASTFYNGSLAVGGFPIRPLAGILGESAAATAGDKPSSPTIFDIIRALLVPLTFVNFDLVNDTTVPNKAGCLPVNVPLSGARLPLPPNRVILTEPQDTKIFEPTPGPGNNGLRPTSPPPQMPTGRNAALLPTSLTAFGAMPVVPFSQSITPLTFSWLAGAAPFNRSTFHQVNPPNPWAGPAPQQLKINPVAGVVPGITAVQTNQFGGPVGVPAFVKQGIQFVKNP